MLKKIILGIISILLLGSVYFIYQNGIRNTQDLKRTIFEATHDRESVAENEAFTNRADAGLFHYARPFRRK